MFGFIRLLLLAFIFLSIYPSLAQKQVLYYSSNWEIAPKETATYFRVCDYNSTYWFFKNEVKDYMLDSTLVMSGSYSTYGIKDGEFIFYYPSGKLQAQGSFRKGLRDGSWKYYYENGGLQREVIFSDSTFSPVVAYDLNGKKTINNGNGPWNFEYERYNEKETAIIKGQFKNGEKDGKWTCLLSSGEVVYREIYKQGKFKSGIVFFPFRSAIRIPFENQFALPYKFEVTEKFKSTPQTERRHYPLLTFLPTDKSDSLGQKNRDDEKVFIAVEKLAEFPGGGAAFMKFLKQNIVYPDEAREKKIQGKVYVKFIVERDGSLSNIELMRRLSPTLDQEALRVISLFPPWKPGKQNGKEVRSVFVLPINFLIPENKNKR